MSELARETRLAHAGIARPPLDQRATVPPIHASVTWLLERQRDLDRALATGDRFIYGRNSNPTVALFEDAVGSLEGGEAVAFASGQAALHAALAAVALRPGDTVAFARDCYGMTRTLVLETLAPLGVRPLAIEANDPVRARAALAGGERVRAVLVEALSNPLVRVADLAALADAAHAAGARLLVDATLATPLLVRPLEHGADLVVHSATKYLAGHGDVLAGIVCGAGELIGAVRRHRAVTGSALGPFEAWLALRGLRTLALRLDRQCRNAAALAAWLEEHPAVGRVSYPGLPSHPDHALAARLFDGGRFGAIISFELADGTLTTVERLLDALALCLPATTLGDLVTELSSPALASHRSLSPEERRAAGIGDRLVRLSVGIEDLSDLKRDLAHALEAAHDR
ncbi:MAG: PLP-dependent aspartate aminotransferase family protein [Chloroflexota bacterium]|nr:PLP-dependent aspartate aminotransferase family protein [Dehalococcoidia bacterium]MDW8253474.1 PLP-dependent aspartate aminotransferase family protein [Chloroflexota bacterium]